MRRKEGSGRKVVNVMGAKKRGEKAELIEMRTKFNKPNKFDDGSDFLAEGARARGRG